MRQLDGWVSHRGAAGLLDANKEGELLLLVGQLVDHLHELWQEATHPIIEQQPQWLAN